MMMEVSLMLAKKRNNRFFQTCIPMIDGKVCNAITSNASAQCCYLCQATSKDFNDIDAMLKRKINEDFLQFGLSTLHLWIRFFE